MSTKGIVDLLHGSREIKEFRSKIGVFSRTQKLRSELTRDSGGFGTSLDGLEPRQRVTQPPRKYSICRIKIFVVLKKLKKLIAKIR